VRRVLAKRKYLTPSANAPLLVDRVGLRNLTIVVLTLLYEYDAQSESVLECSWLALERSRTTVVQYNNMTCLPVTLMKPVKTAFRTKLNFSHVRIDAASCTRDWWRGRVRSSVYSYMLEMSCARANNIIIIMLCTLTGIRVTCGSTAQFRTLCVIYRIVIVIAGIFLDCLLHRVLPV